jgi:hypothetical protein
MKTLEDDDFISYVLAGLDHDYNSFIENVIRKTEISLGSLYCQLLAAETRLELQNSQYQSSANSSACGYGSYHGRGGCQGDGGDRGGFGGHGKAGSGSRTRPVYQL